MKQPPGRLTPPLEPAILSRRRCLQRGAATGLLHLLGGLGSVGTVALFAETAHAGGQLEEPLVDSVRTALTSAISNRAPPVPQFSDAEGRLAYQRWLSRIATRLVRLIPEAHNRQEFSQTVWYESKRAGLDLPLVLGLIEVESHFRKFAVSPVGARGFMQVMPFWVRLIGDGDVSTLFHLQTNLRFGCVILRHYLDREQGDVFVGLGRYNGSRGQAPYAEAVLTARKKWQIGS
jgi:soluble lytic murein transglycosylase-like protein